jgi:mRNA interferase MazF
MTHYKFGDVVLVGFPFTNLQTAKKRPAVILSSEEYNTSRPDIILMAITSRVRHPLITGEALVSNWEEAGLIRPSIFKPLIATIEKNRVIRILGELSQADQETVKGILSGIIDT